jgi:hypothetical protein
MVATSSGRLPDVRRISDAIVKSTGSELTSKHPEWDDNILMVEHRGGWIAISCVQAPIPWSELEGPCATAWSWRQATEKMRSHTAHVMVVIQKGNFSKIERRLLLTNVIWAILEDSDAVGVYWGEGTLVHEPKSFAKYASMASAENLPTHLWVDARIQSKTEHTRRCFTTGLSRFGLMEIEVDDSTMAPEDLYSFVIDLAGYIIGRDANIDDGETVGSDATTQFKVRHCPSFFDRGDVLRIEIP